MRKEQQISHLSFGMTFPLPDYKGDVSPKLQPYKTVPATELRKHYCLPIFSNKLFPEKHIFLLHPRNFSIIFNFFPRNLWVISSNDLPKISPTHSSPTCKALDQLHLVRWQMFRKLWTAARFFRVTKNLGGELTAVWIFVA